MNAFYRSPFGLAEGNGLGRSVLNNPLYDTSTIILFHRTHVNYALRIMNGELL